MSECEVENRSSDFFINRDNDNNDNEKINAVRHLSPNTFSSLDNNNDNVDDDDNDNDWGTIESSDDDDDNGIANDDDNVEAERLKNYQLFKTLDKSKQRSVIEQAWIFAHPCVLLESQLLDDYWNSHQFPVEAKSIFTSEECDKYDPITMEEYSPLDYRRLIRLRSVGNRGDKTALIAYPLDVLYKHIKEKLTNGFEVNDMTTFLPFDYSVFPAVWELQWQRNAEFLQSNVIVEEDENLFKPSLDGKKKDNELDNDDDDEKKKSIRYRHKRKKLTENEELLSLQAIEKLQAEDLAGSTQYNHDGYQDWAPRAKDWSRHTEDWSLGDQSNHGYGHGHGHGNYGQEYSDESYHDQQQLLEYYAQRKKKQSVAQYSGSSGFKEHKIALVSMNSEVKRGGGSVGSSGSIDSAIGRGSGGSGGSGGSRSSSSSSSSSSRDSSSNSNTLVKKDKQEEKRNITTIAAATTTATTTSRIPSTSRILQGKR